ncbi:MAG: hypothetical protein J6Y89_09310 [Lachnospiraceae bacterium]|nr:hypothetical protein [Lachnospiraceae bacterium]
MEKNRIKDINTNSFRIFVGVLLSITVVLCTFGFSHMTPVAAGSGISVSFVGNGEIRGTVGVPIDPYTFTMTINNGGSFLGNYAAGDDVTWLFAGLRNPEKNQYRLTPVGLTVKTVNAISAGDTTGTFVISGTPWMAATYGLQHSIQERYVVSGSTSQTLVGTSGWIYFNISRASGDTKPSSSLSPSSLKITGSQNNSISGKELTFNITGGNFIESFSAGTDVSDWLRSDSYYVDYLNDYEFITALLPQGMTAKLKNAIKPGDRSCTVIISGTPAHGSSDFIAIVPEKGVLATAGNAQSENGYGSLGYGTGCNEDYRYNISGASVAPSITVDDVSVLATVGESIPDNLITFRLHNCTLAKTYAAGTDITGYFEKTNTQGIPVPAMEKFGNNVHVRVVEFNEGADYFTCKIEGTPTANGSCDLKLILFADETSHIVSLRSKRGNARFAVSRPDTSPSVYISGSNFELKTGFSIDPSETAFETGIMGGDSSSTSGVRYKILGVFNKDTDISSYFSGLPSGVKAYAAASASDPQDMMVYLKGVPERAGTYNVKFKVSSMKYMKQTYSGSTSSSWSNDGCTSDLLSSSFLTVTVTDDTNFGYLYDNSLPVTTSELPYEQFVTEAASRQLTVSGRISTQKQVIVENGTPRVTDKSVYNISENTFRLYFPKITISSAYKNDAVMNDMIRLTGSPLTDYEIRLDEENGIAAGTFYGKTITVYLSHVNTTAVAHQGAITLQVKDGSTWKNIVLPTGSAYDINEVIDGNSNPDTSKASGLSASIGDCSINGIAWYMLQDREGIEITLSGAQFTTNAARRYHDVTKWFTNLPANTFAMVKETVTDSVRSTVKIVFAKRKPNSGVTYSTPQSVNTDPIRLTIPFEDITATNGGTAPWSGLNGGVVTTLNSNAVWNILNSDTFSQADKPMIVSNTLTGVYSANPSTGIGTGEMNIFVYIPASVYGTLYQEAQQELENYQQNPDPDMPEELVEQLGKPQLTLKLTGEDGLFNNIYSGSDSIEIQGTGFKELTSSGTPNYQKVYTVTLGCWLGDISASKLASGRFDVSMLTRDSETELTGNHVYLKYQILDKLPEVVEDEEDDENGGSGSDSGDNVVPSGAAPDIWVNGKDNKKEEIYKKSMTKAVSELISSLPDDCKYVLSVTDTSVEDAAGAFSSGKGKKSDIAKASYKKADNAVVVTAGKKEGTARIWIAAVDKKKAVQASGYFDVLVGMAPKKIYITKEKGADVKAAVKSVALSTGESVWLYANANGTELSSHAKFTWTATKGADNLEITPSASAQSAKISVKAAPTDGKVIKATVTMMNVESGKKVNCSVMIVNEVVSITGLSADLTLESALEAAVEKQLDYKFVCADGGETTTDKIKVYTTAALDEGTGYSNTGKKFTLSSKSKIKITYKNGEFKLKVAKKTANGTKCRILVVVTHSDKTIDVFESGVITIGQAAE